jgi:nucleotide-binding universal stress UspA family protein
MKKVLIALDYDQNAKKVAETGFSIAKAMGAEVCLLHVIAEVSYYSLPEYSPITGYTGFMDMGPMKLDSIEELKTASQAYLDKIKLHLNDKTIQTLVKEGNFAESILEAAKDMKADLIVLGSHSRKWLENIVMGSVTEEVLNHTSIPLFIIPTKQKK